MRPESPVKALSYGSSVKSWRTLTPSESAIANTLRQLIAERNAALAAEARRAAAYAEIAAYVAPAALMALIEHGRPVEPVEDQHEIDLRGAANTIETVLAKHGLLPAAATEPEAGAETTTDSGSRETR